MLQPTHTEPNKKSSAYILKKWDEAQAQKKK